MKPATNNTQCSNSVKCALRGKLPEIVEEIYVSYQNTPRTRNIGESPLPNRANIINIVEEIREILFPGYYGISDCVGRMSDTS